MTQRDLINEGWRNVSRLLAEAVPVHAAKLEIEQLIADLRCAERVELEGKLRACEARLEIALAVSEGGGA
jgi:hypothetical protein